MSLLFLDGCDHYTTTEIPAKWTAVGTGSGYVPVTIAAGGRVENCLTWTGTNASPSQPLESLRYAPVVITTSTQGVCGFAIKVTGFGSLNSSPGAPSARCLFSVWGAQGSTHWNASINPDGTVSLYRNNLVGATLLGATGQAMREDQWQFVEFEWTIGHVSGEIKVYINGTLSFSYTGDTCGNDQFGASYTTQWTGVGLMTGYSFGDWKMGIEYQKALTIRIDDFYLLDKGGGVNDAPWGDVTIGYIKPDGAGTTTTWDPSAGANYECVDDDTPDGDTTYVSTSVANEVDTYAHENVPAGAILKALQVVAHVKKGAEGANDLKAVVRIGATDYPSVTTRGVPSNTAYNYLTFPLDTSPATGVAWEEAEVNAAEFGPKKIT